MENRISALGLLLLSLFTVRSVHFKPHLPHHCRALYITRQNILNHSEFFFLLPQHDCRSHTLQQDLQGGSTYRSTLIQIQQSLTESQNQLENPPLIQDSALSLDTAENYNCLKLTTATQGNLTKENLQAYIKLQNNDQYLII